MSDKLQFVVEPAYVDKLKFVGHLASMLTTPHLARRANSGIMENLETRTSCKVTFALDNCHDRAGHSENQS
jgi:hypothetical protein